MLDAARKSMTPSRFKSVRAKQLTSIKSFEKQFMTVVLNRDLNIDIGNLRKFACTRGVGKIPEPYYIRNAVGYVFDATAVTTSHELVPDESADITVGMSTSDESVHEESADFGSVVMTMSESSSGGEQTVASCLPPSEVTMSQEIRDESPHLGSAILTMSQSSSVGQQPDASIMRFSEISNSHGSSDDLPRLRPRVVIEDSLIPDEIIDENDRCDEESDVLRRKRRRLITSATTLSDGVKVMEFNELLINHLNRKKPSLKINELMIKECVGECFKSKYPDWERKVMSFLDVGVLNNENARFLLYSWIRVPELHSAPSGFFKDRLSDESHEIFKRMTLDIMTKGKTVNWGELFEGSVMKYVATNANGVFAGDALSKRVKFYHMQADYTDDKSIRDAALLKHEAVIAATLNLDLEDYLPAFEELLYKTRQLMLSNRESIEDYEINCLDINQIATIHVNVHNKATYLPGHFDTTLHDGHGVVIITIPIEGDADIVLVDYHQENQPSYVCSVNKPEFYVLSGKCRKLLTHGVICTDNGDRMSLNIRIDVHTPEQGKAINKIWLEGIYSFND
jgi:hypothetical protein